MKLSLVILSPNRGPRVNFDLFNAISMAGPDTEVLIVDYAGDTDKREFLDQAQDTNCLVLSLDPCSDCDALAHIQTHASGDFVWLAWDKDYVNAHSLPALHRELRRIGRVPSIIGATGIIMTDDASGTTPSVFNGFDEVPTLEQRLESFLDAQLLPVFHHSPIRRDVLGSVLTFMQSLPVHLPNHDWLMDSLILTHGRLTHIPRYLYQSIEPHCATPELRLRFEAEAFSTAGLDSSAVHVQYLIQAFEGLQTLVTKYLLADADAEDRAKAGWRWFAYWFKQFQQALPMVVHNAACDLEARLLADCWRNRASVSATELLADIADYYSLTSPDLAQRYYDFWNAGEPVPVASVAVPADDCGAITA